MPSDSSSTIIDRLWELLRMLPSRPPGLTTRELHARIEGLGYGVSRRTIERYLLDLSVHFPLVSTTAGKANSWYLMPGSSLDLARLSVSEALTLKMVERHLAALLPDTLLQSLQAHFRQAEQVLEAASAKNTMVRWVDKIRAIPSNQTFLFPRLDPDLLSVLQTALIEERQVQVKYDSRHQNRVTPQVLNPLALLQRGNGTYLLATVTGSDLVRTYAVHRIAEAVALDTGALIPAGFDLDAYLQAGGGGFGMGPAIRLRLSLQERLAQNLREAPLAADMRFEETEDGVIAEATIPDTWQLRWWLLSKGPEVEVLAPADLREHMRVQLQQALAAYEAPAKTAAS